MYKLSYRIVKRTALDGKQWFCVYGKSPLTDKDTFCGKFKYLKNAKYEMKKYEEEI